MCLLLTHLYMKTSTNWNWWPKNLLKTVDPKVLYILAFVNYFIRASWEGTAKEAPELMLSLLLLKQWDFCRTKWWKEVLTRKGKTLCSGFTSLCLGSSSLPIFVFKQVFGEVVAGNHLHHFEDQITGYNHLVQISPLAEGGEKFQSNQMDFTLTYVRFVFYCLIIFSFPDGTSSWSMV